MVIVWLTKPFVPVKVKPPTPPFETLVNVTVGSLLFVHVHAILRPAAVAAAFSVNTFPLNVAEPPEPIPVHAADANAYPAGTVSVIVVTAAAAVKVCIAPETPTPELTVVNT